MNIAFQIGLTALIVTVLFLMIGQTMDMLNKVKYPRFINFIVGSSAMVGILFVSVGCFMWLWS